MKTRADKLQIEKFNFIGVEIAAIDLEAFYIFARSGLKKKKVPDNIAID